MWGDVRSVELSRCYRLMSRFLLLRIGKFCQCPFKSNLIKVGEIISVFYFQYAIKILRKLFWSLYHHGRPNFFYRKETPLLFMVWSHNAIRSVISLVVDPPILIGPGDPLIGKYPQKTSAAPGVFAHH